MELFSGEPKKPKSELSPGVCRLESVGGWRRWGQVGDFSDFPKQTHTGEHLHWNTHCWHGNETLSGLQNLHLPAFEYRIQHVVCERLHGLLWVTPTVVETKRLFGSVCQPVSFLHHSGTTTLSDICCSTHFPTFTVNRRPSDWFHFHTQLCHRGRKCLPHVDGGCRCSTWKKGKYYWAKRAKTQRKCLICGSCNVCRRDYRHGHIFRLTRSGVTTCSTRIIFITPSSFGSMFCSSRFVIFYK